MKPLHKIKGFTQSNGLNLTQKKSNFFIRKKMYENSIEKLIKNERKNNKL